MSNKNNEVEPYSFGMTAFIVIGLSLLDTVGGIVLLVGTYIFMKKGHTGLSVALVIANFVVPDILPAVDEIFTVIIFVCTYNKNRAEGKSISESVKASKQAVQQYSETSRDYIQKSEKVVNKIRVPQNQEIDYDSNYYDNDYYNKS